MVHNLNSRQELTFLKYCCDFLRRFLTRGGFRIVMVNVFIIHGSYGHPDENWFSWLKKELEKLGCKVFVPRFPTPEGQNLDSWMKVISGYDDLLDNNSIIVGHSMGCALILR